ncbi:Uncharacterized protein HZ326_10466 [Fusarium oxysporum f. sp. albedinis]|nr:Uncharacterized protein HZ326_10466 [Fusarium oxysporum f. sp. albedinis]
MVTKPTRERHPSRSRKSDTFTERGMDVVSRKTNKWWLAMERENQQPRAWTNQLSVECLPFEAELVFIRELSRIVLHCPLQLSFHQMPASSLEGDLVVACAQSSPRLAKTIDVTSREISSVCVSLR